MSARNVLLGATAVLALAAGPTVAIVATAPAAEAAPTCNPPGPATRGVLLREGRWLVEWTSSGPRLRWEPSKCVPLRSGHYIP